MGANLFIVIGAIAIFVLLGVGMSMSIKKHDKMAKQAKKKKGRNKYMPVSRRPGR
ncbi:MAG: hypothetical protein Q8920_00765 [Bacillota bacterium]|nr:hypothetical protein [Bacillota bacterium]